MIKAAAVAPHAPGQHQPGDGGAIQQVVVVPVIDARTDDDRALALGFLGGGRPLARELDHGLPVDAGEAFLPGGRIRAGLVVVALRVVARQPAPHAELRHQQVVDRHDQGRPVARLDAPRRNSARHVAVERELVERDRGNLVAVVQQRQRRIDGGAVDAILHLEIPLALGLLPAKAERALRHPDRASGAVPHQELRAGVLRVRVSLELAGAQQPARRVRVTIPV